MSQKSVKLNIEIWGSQLDMIFNNLFVSLLKLYNIMQIGKKL